jgi:hypothetical protein
MSNEKHSPLRATYSGLLFTGIRCERNRRAAQIQSELAWEEGRQKKETRQERRREQKQRYKARVREAKKPEREEKARRKEEARQQEFKKLEKEMTGEVGRAIREKANEIRWMEKRGVDPEEIQRSKETLEAEREENERKRKRFESLKSQEKKRKERREERERRAIGEAGEEVTGEEITLFFPYLTNT